MTALRIKFSDLKLFSFLLLMQAPQVQVWGPALWSLFHALAEKAGQRPRIESEEKRLWRQFLLSLRAVIPCPACQKHYNDYIKIHSWTPVLEGDGWGSRIKHWFWEFHNAVRGSKGQPLEFEEGRLATAYTRSKADLVPFKQIWTEHMRRGLALHLLTRDDMQRSLRFLEELILLIF
jgi:hypothetical protein